MKYVSPFIQDTLREHREYWHQKLAGTLHPCSVPYDFVEQKFGGGRFDTQGAQLDHEVATRLRQASRGNENLLLTLLVAALEICLSWYTGDEDVRVGTPIRKIDQEIAIYNTTLVIRNPVYREMSFHEFADCVKRVLAEAYEHQIFPLEELSFNGREANRRSALASVVIGMESLNCPDHLMDIKPDVAFWWSKWGTDGLSCEVKYRSDILRPSTIAEFVKRYLSILTDIASKPDTKLSELMRMPDRDRNKIVGDWNNTSVRVPSGCVHEWFEERVRMEPESTAIEQAGAKISYYDLNERSNRVARYLRKKGIDTESKVGISIEHCAELVVAILGILKAGAAYMPVDPVQPAEKLRVIEAESGVAEWLSKQRVIDIVSEMTESGVPSHRDETSGAGDRNLAYVLYTSGSTGRPKGVGIEHEALKNYVHWARTIYTLGPNCRMDFPLYSSVAFDLTVTSIFTPLVTGGCIHIYSNVSGREALISQVVSDGKSGTIKLTPSHLAMLGPIKNGELRQLIVGGEALRAELVSRVIRDASEELVVWNEYGPTEATVGCALYRYDSRPNASNDENTDSRACVPIGRPGNNMQVYILDGAGEIAPVGAPGEIYIGGLCLARGYLGQAALTAERFTPDALGGRPGQRLYRTGDWGRYRSDGNIEYLGRRDEQVKIRGTRVELGEIRTALNRCQGVRDSVVVVQSDENSYPAVVAYYAARQEIDPKVLREHLSKFVNREVLPNFIVFVPKIPLTENGKVNPLGLPKLNEIRSRMVERGEVERARTPVEEILVGIWGEVLKVKEVGVGENFFELGGHSLLATQLISRVSEVLGVQLPVRALFETPTVSGIAEQVERARGRGETARLPALGKSEREGDLPLSNAQQRLWFLDQLEPGTAVYNIPQAVRMEGEIEVEGLQWALSEIMRRHEVLRTSFPVEEGQARQRIAKAEKMAMPVVDVSEGGEGLAREIAELEAVRPFDLGRGPVWRAKLLRMGEREHVLLVTMHHIVSDGWSVGVLISEFTELYGAWRERRPSRLEELEVQYGDFAVWQRGWLEGEVLEEQLKYWKEQLKELVPLELPTDRTRPAVASHRGATHTFRIGAETVEGLEELSKREGVTLFMSLLAAFEVLLARYSGQWDIAVGTPIANRRHVGIEKLIGFFVNTLVLRVRMEGEESFRELLGKVREATLEGYEHQDVPFEKLVEELAPQRDMSRSPLFQVMFGMDNSNRDESHLDGIGAEIWQSPGGIAKFDLTLMLRGADNGLQATLEYATDLFDRETIERMVEHYEELLKGVQREPEKRLREYEFLTGREREQVLEQWSGSGEEYEAGRCVHELFEEQVERTPDAVAVVCGQEQISYRELNGRANEVAWRLRERGVGAETRVGLCIERSIEMVVGMMGILKAGGAYVPLDPGYPSDRLAYMLEEVQAPVVLTEERLQGGLAAGWAQVMCIEEVEGGKSENLPTVTSAENLAYVIFTSGSTGRPKGVQVTLSALQNVLQFFEHEIKLSREDLVYASTPLSFDIAALEILLPLMNGCRLALTCSKADDRSLSGEAEREQATVLQGTPSGWKLAVSERDESLERCKAVLCGGELLPQDLAAQLLARRASLWNVYGPTETTIWSTTVRVTSATESPCIGQAIQHTQVYVLDEWMEAVGVGMSGELYVGGAGVARGYLNRADLTGERFVPDPFGGVGGRRLYRTGDRGRWRADGTLEYLGRMDEQVKVRGYRIEPGEIEAALMGVGGIKQAAVIVREDEPGDKRLVAYVVEEKGKGELESGKIKEELRKRLPEYMVPWVVMKVEELPLNANGKLDRKKLPKPEARVERGEVERARTPVEEILVGIWGEVLKVKEVGVGENFFELGGHSLLATQLISRVSEVLGVQLPVRALFETPTVSGIAEQVERARGRGETTRLPALGKSEREGDLPLSNAQQRLWFLDQLEPGTAVYNIPQAVRMEGEIQVEGLQWALSEIMRRHEVLRTSFPVEEGQARQRIAKAEKMAMPVVDVSEGGEGLAREIAELEAVRPFDLGRGPVWRAKLLRMGEREHVLLVTMHHIVSDGWSVGVLISEFTELYGAWRERRPSRLEELEVQYGDFAVWQRGWLEGEVLEEQLKYWKEQLKELVPLELPTDRTRPAMASRRGGMYRFRIGAETVEGLKELSKREGVTLFMSLLAAFEVLLARYSGQWDIAVGTDIANRKHVELEKLIGFFVNQLVLRVRMEGEESFRELLGKVREATLEGYEHQDVPFEKLVEELAPQRDMSRSPLFQVKLVMQNAPQSKVEAGDLQIEGWEGQRELAILDLTMSLTEERGGLAGWLEYATDLFDRETIERMVEHYEELLKGVQREPEKRLREYEFLTEREREQVLEQWSGSGEEYEAGRCVHELFEEQVERTPDAVAVVCGSQRLSYRDLNEAANRLAHYLVELGAGPETIVGICMDRSVDFVVAILAVLKSGAGYSPLDPTYPSERLGFMIDDSRAAVILTCGNDINHIQTGWTKVVDLSSEEQIAHQTCTNPNVQAAGEQTAYVIYTSGSTGQPKGVAISHRNLWHSSTARWMTYKRPIQGYMLLSSFAFDSSVAGLFWTLGQGGTLHIPREGEHRDINSLVTQIEQNSISHILSLPSLYAKILGHADQKKLSSLRVVIVAGEACETDLVKQHDKLLPAAELYNEYGPTEGTVWASVYEHSHGTVRPRIPIGKPITTMTVRILGESLDPTPTGVPGELFIGGPSVSRGYRNRPELTAARFLPDPYSHVAGARLYRTGDRARWLADGNVEYLGRLDEQVKLRGYRIELGEIESIIRTHPRVGQAAVTLQTGAMGDAKLVAYVTEKPEYSASIATDEAVRLEAPMVSELRALLRLNLPEYMIPTEFARTVELPFTENGKLNRRALPLLASRDDSSSYIAPRNSLEEILAGIWAETLKRNRIGVEQNFFELGGHSLTVVQVVARIRTTLGIEVSVGSLFEAPTVAELSRKIEEQLRLHHSASDLMASQCKGGASIQSMIDELETLSEDEAKELLRAEDQVEP